MTVAILLHPYIALAGTDTTAVGAASLRHTLDVLHALDTPVLSVLPDRQLPLLTDALRLRGRDASAILHPGRLGQAAGVALAALHLREQEEDPVLIVCHSPLRLIDGQHLLQLLRRGQPLAQGGAIVNLATLLPLRGEPNARYQLLTGAPQPDGSRPVLQVGRRLLDDSPEHLVFHASGLTLVRANTYLNAMALHAPHVLAACRQAINQARYGKTRLGATHRPGSPASELHCVWPEPAALHRAVAGDIEHQVLTHYRPQLVLPCDGSWLPPDAPLRPAHRPAPASPPPLRTA